MSTAKTYPNIQLLDHGYIKLIETWGSDERIIEAARMSTDGAFLQRCGNPPIRNAHGEELPCLQGIREKAR
jgi:hypothetical protein